MNKEIQTVLFGAQKQSLRQNVAIVNFVDHVIANEPGNTTEEKILSKLKSLYEFYNTDSCIATDYDESDLFLQYVVGVDAYEVIKSKTKGVFVSHGVGDNGKVVFDFVPSEDAELNDTIAGLFESSKVWESGDGKKAASNEDKAYELVKKILSMCPPAMRAELPQDDVLAAVVLSEQYWKVFG